jgi:hypothetical protein
MPTVRWHAALYARQTKNRQDPYSRPNSFSAPVRHVVGAFFLRIWGCMSIILGLTSTLLCRSPWSFSSIYTSFFGTEICVAIKSTCLDSCFFNHFVSNDFCSTFESQNHYKGLINLGIGSNLGYRINLNWFFHLVTLSYIFLRLNEMGWRK